MEESYLPNPDAPVTVIGAAVVDIVGRLRSEMVLETSNAARIRSSFGGVARNVAENLARLGQDARLISVVGMDPEGDQLITQVAGAGVDVSNILRTRDFPTGEYIGVLDNRGAFRIALDDMRMMTVLTPEYIRDHESMFKDSSMIVIDANIPKDSLRTIFTLARRFKLPVCADPTAFGLATRLKPYLSRIFMLIPNAVEAGILCDREVDQAKRRQVLDAAKCLVTQGVQIAIITLGEHGVCYATSETSGQIPAIRTEIVDPIGAGDALTAAVIVGLLNGIELDESLRLGVSAATLTLRHAGAVVPDLTLQALYDQLVI